MSEPMSRDDFIAIFDRGVKPIVDNINDVKTEVSGIKTELSIISKDVNNTKKNGEIANLKISHIQENQERIEKQFEKDKEKSEVNNAANWKLTRSVDTKVKVYIGVATILFGMIITLLEFIK